MAPFKGDIDSSHVPVDGAAGLGLLVLAAVVIYALAPLRSLFVAMMLGGAVIAFVLMAWRHRETRSAAIGGIVLAVIALVVILATTLAHRG